MDAPSLTGRGDTLSRDDWKEIFALLDVALELEPGRVEAWLETLPPPQVRHAATLRKLLADRAALDTGEFMRAPARSGLEPATGSLLAAQALVGPYRLLSEIGRGGTATVWLAERADGLLDRRVALKLPHLSWGGAAFAERTARERNILASLAHPNIARLYDAGVDAEGRPFLALEYVDGQPIDVYARSRDLSVPERIGLLVQVARAVGHAHAQLVVHRDLKPSNILVDPQGRVHLVDFGIAKLIDPPLDGAGEASQLTLVTGRALTPDYASPEQIRGDAIGTASDVYSLGVVAFELLAGVRPYRLNAGLGAVALADALAGTEVPRASDMAANDGLRRALKGDLDAIVSRMLAKASHERYASVDVVADELERHLRGEPVQARAPSRWYVAERWIRRHKLETGIGVALALALLGGAYAQVLVIAALAVGALAALWQRDQAVKQAELARAALERGEQVKNFIASIFTQAVPRAGRGGAVAATDLLQAAARRIETDLAAQPAVAAELGELIGASFNELGDVRAWLDWLPRAVELCTREFGPTHRLTLQSRRRLVEAANTVGELEVSERVLPSLVADLRAVQPAEPALLVLVLQSEAFVLTKRGRQAAAMAALHEGVAVASEHFGQASDTALGACAALSNTYVHFGRYPEALSSIESALSTAYGAFGDLRPHPTLTMIERCHADALAMNRRPREAAAILRQVLADQRALDVDDTHRVRVALHMLARALLFGGHFGEARSLFAEAVALLEQLGAAGSAENAGGWMWLSLACAYGGDGEAALSDVRRAAQAQGGREEADLHADARRCAQALAEAVAGEYADALVTVEPLLRRSPPMSGLVGLRAHRVRALALRLSGSADALGAAQAALTISEPDAAVLETGLLRVEAARCCIATGDVASATTHWHEALDAFRAGQIDGFELLEPLHAEFASLPARS